MISRHLLSREGEAYRYSGHIPVPLAHYDSVCELVATTSSTESLTLPDSIDRESTTQICEDSTYQPQRSNVRLGHRDDQYLMDFKELACSVA